MKKDDISNHVDVFSVNEIIYLLGKWRLNKHPRFYLIYLQVAKYLFKKTQNIDNCINMGTCHVVLSLGIDAK